MAPAPQHRSAARGQDQRRRHHQMHRIADEHDLPGRQPGEHQPLGAGIDAGEDQKGDEDEPDAHQAPVFERRDDHRECGMASGNSVSNITMGT